VRLINLTEVIEGGPVTAPCLEEGSPVAAEKESSSDKRTHATDVQ
jgi:hypothetical protein